MIRFFINTAVNLASSAVALLVAAWLLEDVSITTRGFITAVVIFVVAQAFLGPFVFKMARKYAPAALGGIGLISTLLALWLATIFGGLTISGAGTWALATILVWVVTSLGGWALLAFWLKKRESGSSD